MILKTYSLNLIRMSNVVDAFELEIKQSKLSKTDKYWLDQEYFKFEDKNLNIHVRS